MKLSSLLILCILLIGFDSQAQLPELAFEVCKPLRDQRLQDSNYQNRISNCENMVAQGKVKNIEALRYTMEYFASNYGKLRDPSCTMYTAAWDDKCDLCQKPDLIARGIRNGCTMVINDVEADYPTNPKRSTGYYLNLCSNNPHSNVQVFYINRGKGHTGKTMYDDNPDEKGKGKKTTVMGAFLTDTSVGIFTPFSKEENYRGLCKTTPKEVRLLGVNSTNNNTAFSKPLHVSPYESSWGCPSVSCEMIPMMRELAENGPSLFMNYASSRMDNAPMNVRTGETCQNGPDDIDAPENQSSQSVRQNSIQPQKAK